MTNIFNLCFVCLSATAGFAQDGERGQPRDYYPINPGIKRYYRVETTNGKVYHEVESSREEVINGQTLICLEFSINGKVRDTRHLSKNTKGVFVHYINREKVLPAVATLKYPLLPGTEWEEKYKVGKELRRAISHIGLEEVVVPIGKFDAVYLEVCESRGQNPGVISKFWLVAGIGCVKGISPYGRGQAILTLERFEMNGKK